MAELDHAAARGWRSRLRLAAGTLPDAVATRAVQHTRRPSLPRGRVFAGIHQDIRFAVRGLFKARGFTIGVISSLAVGIGANLTAITFINAAVYRPFPSVRDQHELVRFTLGGDSYQKFSTIATSYRDYQVMRETLTTVEGLSALRDGTFAVRPEEGQPASVRGALVSANYFRVLGVTPAAGRFFAEDEDGVSAHPVAIISDVLWDKYYGRAPAAIGSALLVNGAPVQIIGVTPPRFIGIRRAENPARIWLPLAMGHLTLRDRDGRATTIESAGPLWLDLVGRRRPGITVDRVEAEAATLRERLDATRNRARARVAVMGVWLNNPEQIGGEIAAFMMIPLLVLAIACVNAANLVLARSSRAVRDWTLRVAVGATRWRVVRQVLVEALLLSAVAAGVGLALAQWGLSLVADQLPVPTPIDGRVALFTILFVIVTAVTFSFAPALNVMTLAQRHLAVGSAGAGRVRSRTRFALVALQAALSLGLLATGAQFTKTVRAASPTEHIPAPESLVLATFDLDPLRFAAGAGEDFYTRALNRVRAVPGVASAAVASNGLVSGLSRRDNYAPVWVEDSAAAGTSVPAFHVTANFFATLGVAVKQGRAFSETDTRPSTTVRSVIVNTPFADKFLGGHALGRTFRLGRPSPAPADGVESGMVIVTNGVRRYSPRGPEPARQDALEVTVVGIVDGVMSRAGQEPAIVYYPAPLVYQPARMLYLRLDATRAFTAAALQSALREIDARVPVVELATLEEIRSRRNREMKTLTNAAAILGILALALAAGGLYSVVSYVVSLRQQEVGIRLALGADGRAIVSMIVRQALLPTLLGASIGAAAAAAAGALIRSRMYGATPVDPIVFGAATALMLAVMIVASWLPARQAGRVDPVQVLRQE